MINHRLPPEPRAELVARTAGLSPGAARRPRDMLMVSSLPDTAGSAATGKGAAEAIGRSAPMTVLATGEAGLLTLKTGAPAANFPVQRVRGAGPGLPASAVAEEAAQLRTADPRTGIVSGRRSFAAKAALAPRVPAAPDHRDAPTREGKTEAVAGRPGALLMALDMRGETEVPTVNRPVQRVRGGTDTGLPASAVAEEAAQLRTADPRTGIVSGPLPDLTVPGHPRCLRAGKREKRGDAPTPEGRKTGAVAGRPGALLMALDMRGETEAPTVNHPVQRVRGGTDTGLPASAVAKAALPPRASEAPDHRDAPTPEDGKTEAVAGRPGALLMALDMRGETEAPTVNRPVQRVGTGTGLPASAVAEEGAQLRTADPRTGIVSGPRSFAAKAALPPRVPAAPDHRDAPTLEGGKTGAVADRPAALLMALDMRGKTGTVADRPAALLMALDMREKTEAVAARPGALLMALDMRGETEAPTVNRPVQRVRGTGTGLPASAVAEERAQLRTADPRTGIVSGPRSFAAKAALPPRVPAAPDHRDAPTPEGGKTGAVAGRRSGTLRLSLDLRVASLPVVRGGMTLQTRNRASGCKN